MSDLVDLPLLILQKAQHAAEAAAASAKLLESEAGHRLGGIEIRMGSVEGRLVGIEARLSALYAGQGAHTLAIMRIADTQSEHTVRLDAIDQRLGAIDKRLGAIDQRLGGIEQTLAAILGKLP
jgi:hypothetical protein